MRTRALAAAVLALSLLAACGDDEPSGTTPSASTSEEEGSASEETAEETGDTTELEAAVEAGQLEAEDLGEGWELSDTKAPGEDDDDDEPNPLDACMVENLDDRFDDATVAESEERSFTRTGTGPVPDEVTSSSIAVDDPALYGEMHEVFRSPEFGDCLRGAFEEAMGQDGAIEVELGEIAQAEGVIDPGEDDELESTGLSFPMRISAQGTTVELVANMTLLSTGQLGSSVMYFGSDEELIAESVAEWGRLIAERLVGG